MMGGMGGMMGGTGGDMGDDLDDSDNEVETVEMAELSQILVAPDVSGCAQFRPLEFYSTMSDLQRLQLFCMEHKIKLSQVDHICLTCVCSETVGGLPGLLLTLADMNNESPQSVGKIWGPPNLDSLVNAMKTFVPHVVMKNKNIIPQSGSALVPSLHAEELRADGKFKAVRGKLTLGKAEACGIKDKRRLGQLQKGFSVKSDFLDIEVHPNDLRAGLGSAIPKAYSPETVKVVNCLIHLGPASVINSPVYEKWMRKFDFAQHIMVDV
ncbi:hypothetical protein BC332_12700 [Capsicum chinense]|nr:hypothetical protein BC332_12700 [Capsicum chinense]